MVESFDPTTGSVLRQSLPDVAWSTCTTYSLCVCVCVSQPRLTRNLSPVQWFTITTAGNADRKAEMFKISALQFCSVQYQSKYFGTKTDAARLHDHDTYVQSVTPRSWWMKYACL
jgi:hypothetical protein